MRFSTVELAELESQDRLAPPTARWRIELALFDELVAGAARAARGRSPRPPRRSPVSTSPAALAELAARPRLDAAAASTTSLAFEIEGGRHPVVEEALQARAARPSSPTIATSRGPEARAHLADHRPQHGRQVDLPAPERADRRARPDGLLRAGERGADRHRRPAVQPRRRRRRSRARPLDLHGRDGRDRRDPQPGDARARLVILDEIGRGTATYDGLSIAWAVVEHLHEAQPLPRPVRHPLPRADRARRAAAAPRQRDPARSPNGRARSSSCTRSCRAPPTAPTASRSRASPACRRRSSSGRRRSWPSWRSSDRERPKRALVDDLPLFAAHVRQEPHRSEAGSSCGTRSRRSIRTR